MKIHVKKEFSEAEKKELEIQDLKKRLEAAEDALIVLMFGGSANV